MDILEAITFTPPFSSSSFGSPAKFDLPTGGISRFLANKVWDYITQTSPGIYQDVTRIDFLELSHDFHSGKRHSRVLAFRGSQELWFQVEYSEVRGVTITPVNLSGSRIVFVTAVFQREARLRRLVELLARVSQGKYSREGPLAVCMINYEGNPYNMRELLTVLPPSMQVLVVDMKGPFMKAPGLQKCIDVLREDDIAFILDVDIEIDDHLVKNIRRAVVQGQTFFTPIGMFVCWLRWLVGWLFSRAKTEFALLSKSIMRVWTQTEPGTRTARSATPQWEQGSLGREN